MLPEISLDWLQARVREDDDGCWIWTGYMTKHGQPQARVDHKFFLVRRALWELKHEKECKTETFVGVKCKKPGCCHPDCIVGRTRSAAMRGGKKTLAQRARIAMSKRATSTVPDSVIAEILTSDECAVHISRRLGLSDSYASAVRSGRIRADFRNPFAGLR